MSRRIAITPRQGQLRAASRMTVGTKMWAEQPTPERRDRQILPLDRPPKPPLLPPTSIRYMDESVDIGSGAIGASLTAHLLAGEQTILIVCSQQIITINPAWTTLLVGEVGGLRWAAVSMTAPATGSYPVATTGPEEHPFHALSFAGMAFTSLSTYQFLVRKKTDGIGNPITVHAWGGFSDTYRMRVLVVVGSYTGWSGGLGNATGHSGNNLGYIWPFPNWWNVGPYTGPPFISTPETYLTAPWVEGASTSGTFGVIGPLRWVELHIRVGRP